MIQALGVCMALHIPVLRLVAFSVSGIYGCIHGYPYCYRNLTSQRFIAKLKFPKFIKPGDSRLKK